MALTWPQHSETTLVLAVPSSPSPLWPGMEQSLWLSPVVSWLTDLGWGRGAGASG